MSNNREKYIEKNFDDAQVKMVKISRQDRKKKFTV
jgi:hypothetical protein